MKEDIRLEFETYSTGGKNISTPEEGRPLSDLPAFLGFDRLESYYFGFEAKPNENLIANLSFNVIGRVAENPIDEIFYENRGRPVTIEVDGEDFRFERHRAREGVPRRDHVGRAHASSSMPSTAPGTFTGATKATSSASTVKRTTARTSTFTTGMRRTAWSSPANVNSRAGSSRSARSSGGARTRRSSSSTRGTSPGVTTTALFPRRVRAAEQHHHPRSQCQFRRPDGRRSIWREGLPRREVRGRRNLVRLDEDRRQLPGFGTNATVSRSYLEDRVKEGDTFGGKAKGESHARGRVNWYPPGRIHGQSSPTVVRPPFRTSPAGVSSTRACGTRATSCRASPMRSATGRSDRTSLFPEAARGSDPRRRPGTGPPA